MKNFQYFFALQYLRMDILVSIFWFAYFVRDIMSDYQTDLSRMERGECLKTQKLICSESGVLGLYRTVVILDGESITFDVFNVPFCIALK